MIGKHTGAVSYDVLRPRRVRRGDLSRFAQTDYLVPHRTHVRRVPKPCVLDLIAA
jgi:hypothetical protein